MTFPILLTQRLRDALAKAVPDLPADVTLDVTPAADTRYGDYQANAAMVLAKRLGRNPRALAADIIAAFDTADLCGTPEIAGPGFINFRISPAVLAGRLSELLGDAKLGVAPVATPRTVVIDFSAPNVAKRMHVGHIRSTIIGDALARIARFVGHRVITDNHIGDWGTQFGMVIYGWKHFRDEPALEADAIGELLRLYKKVNELEKADPGIREACKAELVKLQQGDPDNRAIWERVVAASLKALDAIYRRLDVTFDHTLGESFYNDRLAPLVEEFLNRGLARESEGAVCIFFEDVPAMKDKAPAIIRKSDGGFGYATTDLATVEYRVKEWNADEIWYVVGQPQALHLEQVFEACRRWGFAPKMTHVAFGSILGPDGRMFKTRSGESVGLVEVLEEAVERARGIVEGKNPDLSEEEKTAVALSVGLGAVKYAELSQHRLTDYKFSWEKMLSLQGNTAPYLQNAYVRSRAIFRKLDEAPDLAGPFPIGEDAERALLLKLAQFAEVVPAVLEDFRPNLLAAYLYDVATGFHSFYEACPVLRSEGTVRAARLAICELTSRVLRTGLGLLGITVTDKM